jgi:hypothetical protein
MHLNNGHQNQNLVFFPWRRLYLDARAIARNYQLPAYHDVFSCRFGNVAVLQIVYDHSNDREHDCDNSEGDVWD